jgi:hypothetical protein
MILKHRTSAGHKEQNGMSVLVKEKCCKMNFVSSNLHMAEKLKQNFNRLF